MKLTFFKLFFKNIFRLISAVWRMQYHHSLRQQMHPRHQRLYHSCQYNQELRRRHMGSGSASNPPQAAHHAPPDYANMYPHAPAVPAPMPAHLGRLPPGGLANPHSYIQNPGTGFFLLFCSFFCLLFSFGPFGPFCPFDLLVHLNMFMLAICAILTIWARSLQTMTIYQSRKGWPYNANIEQIPSSKH